MNKYQIVALLLFFNFPKLSAEPLRVTDWFAGVYSKLSATEVATIYIIDKNCVGLSFDGKSYKFLFHSDNEVIHERISFLIGDTSVDVTDSSKYIEYEYTKGEFIYNHLLGISVAGRADVKAITYTVQFSNDTKRAIQIESRIDKDGNIISSEHRHIIRSHSE